MINKQILQEQLLVAIKNQNGAKKRVLRLLLTSIKLSEVNKGAALSETELLSLIQKEIKTKQETIADAQKAARQDLIIESEDDIKILQEYLPKQMTTTEISALAAEVIKELGATSIKDMGNVMKILIAKLAGRATNQEASKVVRNLLQDK